MKPHFLLLIGWLLCCCLPASASDDITKELITSNGKTRAYYLYLPPAAKPGTPLPMILMLHGSGHVGMSLAEKWKDLAKKEGFIIAAPDSLDARMWNMPSDGPDFLHELVEELKTKYPVNPRRVYLFGHSGGAVYALLMSLLESQYFAATAVHAGDIPPGNRDLLELAQRKMPIQIQLGDSDRLFPLKMVRATRDLMKEKGFPVELVEIAGHDHWYYDLAPKINLKAWEFLKIYQLDADPIYQKFNFNK